MKDELMFQYESETSKSALSGFYPSLEYVEWLELKINKVKEETNREMSPTIKIHNIRYILGMIA